MRKVASSIYPFAMFLVVITLLFPRGANNWSIILLCITWILSGGFSKKNFQVILKNKPSLFAIGFLVVYVLGISYAENIREAGSIIVRLAPLLIFPVTLSSLANRKGAWIDKIPSIFIFATFLAVLIALAVALGRTTQSGLYFTDPDNGIVTNNFVYHRLASAIGIHAGFTGLFVSFALILVINELLSKQRIFISKVAYFFLLLFFICFIILLQTGVIYLSLGFSLLGFLYFMPRKIGGRTAKVLRFIIPVLAVVSLISVTSKINLDGYLYKFDMTWMPPEGNWNSVNLRLALWENAIEAINNSMPWGVGTGDEVDCLVGYYQKNKFAYAAQERLHPHNQFISTALTVGIPGLIMLLGIFVFSFWNAIKRRNLIYLVLLCLMVAFCITDIPLVRNKPAIFFMLFLNYFEYTFLNPHKK